MLGAGLGLTALTVSYAGALKSAVEAEAGAPSNPDLIMSGQTASGGKYISFKAPAVAAPPANPSQATTALYQHVCSQAITTTAAGSLGDSSLKEVSGIAASRAAADTYWVHNDSGDSARIFKISGSGALQGTYNLSGAKAVDWEDIVVGPGPVSGQSFIYLADTGDNHLDRPSVQIYRVAEPTVTGKTADVSGVETLNFTYPGGTAHNVEAVFIDTTGELYFIDKSTDRPGQVFKAPAGLKAGSTTTLTAVGTIGFKKGSSYEEITGADLSPDGSTLAIRTYDHLYVLDRPSGSSLGAALGSKACAMPSFSEDKGEAVAFQSDGQGLITTSEGVKAPIHSFAIKP